MQTIKISLLLLIFPRNVQGGIKRIHLVVFTKQLLCYHSLSSGVLPWRGSGWCSWWPCEGVRPVWLEAWVPSPNPGPWCSNPVWRGRRSCWSPWHSRVALRREKKRRLIFQHECNVCHIFMLSQSKLHAIYLLFLNGETLALSPTSDQLEPNWIHFYSKCVWLVNILCKKAKVLEGSKIWVSSVIITSQHKIPFLTNTQSNGYIPSVPLQHKLVSLAFLTLALIRCLAFAGPVVVTANEILSPRLSVRICGVMWGLFKSQMDLSNG